MRVLNLKKYSGFGTPIYKVQETVKLMTKIINSAINKKIIRAFKINLKIFPIKICQGQITKIMF